MAVELVRIFVMSGRMAIINNNYYVTSSSLFITLQELYGNGLVSGFRRTLI